MKKETTDYITTYPTLEGNILVVKTKDGKTYIDEEKIKK